MLYDGFNNDINDASYKLSKIALRNTPSKNPKEYKTTAEREAQKNEGKVASITNLLDEMDTTIFVINDKLDNSEMDDGLSGGTNVGRRGNSRLPVDHIKDINNPELLEEVKKRGLTNLLPSKHKKADYVRVLEPFADTILKEFNDSLPPLPTQTTTNAPPQEEPKAPATPKEEPRALVPLTPQSLGETPIAGREQQNVSYDDTSSEEEEFPFRGTAPRNEEPFNRILDEEIDEESEVDDFDTEEESEVDDFDTESEVDDFNTDEGSNEDDFYSAVDEKSENGGDGGDGGDDKKENNLYDGLIQSDLNSNIMKLEEQVNRLSKLTKGLNQVINYSSASEAEKLSQSNKTLSVSYEQLITNIERIPNIYERFDTKMKSILNKISNQYNIIQSALGGYSGEYITGGSFLSASLVPIATQLMRGAGREENLAYLNSSRKRFY